MANHLTPFANWRWWASLPLMLAVTPVAFFLIAVKAVGEMAEMGCDMLQLSTVRPLLRWTWPETDRD